MSKVKIVYPVVNFLVESVFFVLNKQFQNHRCLNYSQNQSGYLREKVNKEDIVIPYPYAVVDPRAVVIVSVDTSVANNAMTRSICSNGLALWTKRL